MAKWVTIRLFAGLRERLGGDTVAVELPDDAVVADLHRALAERFPEAQAVLLRCAVAVNEEYAHTDQTIPGSGEIALLPPVSGG